MQRTSPVVITGWWAVLLAPIAIPIALLAGLWPGKKTVDRTAEDVAGFLRDFLEGSGGQWDWDEFECVPITDPKLDAIREQAALAGPPNPDLAELRRLLVEAEAMAIEAASTPKSSAEAAVDTYRAILATAGTPLAPFNPGSSECALNRAAAVRAIEALEGTRHAVLGGDVVEIVGERLRHADNWHIERRPGETDEAFAERSRDYALRMIEELCPNSPAEPLFVLVTL